MRVVFRIDDLALDAPHCLAHRSDHVVRRRIRKHSRGGFRQPIGLQNVDAQRVEVAGNFRIEARPSRDQITHLLAERLVDFAKQNSTSIDPGLAQTAIEAHETLKQLLRQCSAFSGLLEDALVNQIKELRHYGEGRDIPFLQSP